MRPMEHFSLGLLILAIVQVQSKISHYNGPDIHVTMVNEDKDFLGSMSRSVYDEKPYKKIGDMMFTEETWTLWNSQARGIIPDTSMRWPKDSSGNYIVPYTIASNYTGSVAALTDGMAQWSSKTCVKFYEKSNLALPTGTGSNWITFINAGDNSCWSYIGNINEGGQPLNIGTGCDTSNIVAHEVGHALGFGHEHQRSDRDDYLTMFAQNVLAGNSNNFDKDNFNNYGVPYDYLSNMHYFWNAFSTSQSLPTMMPKDPSLKYLLTKNNPVDHYDALTANLAFGCIDNWKASCGATAPTCKNFGYLGKSCLCVCPDGTSGADCGSLDVPSLPKYPQPVCGGSIKTAGTYSTPNISLARSAVDCTWSINPPTCQIAEVTITSFNLKDVWSTNCGVEYLSIATVNPYVANIGPLCGSATVTPTSVVPSGTKYTGSPSVALYFTSRVNYGGGATGFQFTVNFVTNTSCTAPTTTQAASTTTPTTMTVSTTKVTTAATSTSTTAATSKSTTAATSTSTTTRPTSPTATTKPTTILTTITTKPTTATTKPTTATTIPSTVTTKPTTSTTTRPTTTTTVRTTTVTLPSNPTQCTLGTINGTGQLYWLSPNYPGLAPPNSRCTILVQTSASGLSLNIVDFAVPAVDAVCSNAYTVILPTFPLAKLCNNNSGKTMTLASNFFIAQYQSDPTKATAGFKILISSF